MADVIKAPAIGPGDLSSAGTKGGRPFLLSKSEWLSIQRFVNDGVMLPTDEAKFKASLGSGAQSDLSEFKPLIDVYVDINKNCSNWRDSIFPDSVDLASDIYNYGKNLAPVYYPPISQLADDIDADPTNAKLKTKLKALLTKLSEEAQTRADKAAAVSKKVKDFANDTLDSKNQLVGADGKGGLNKIYDDKFGSASADVISLRSQIDDMNKLLKNLNDEYDHDVVVAATSPTYAWVWPIGTIAAAIVAGIYGDKAVKALDRIKSTQATLETLNSKLAADANLMITINQADIGLDNMVNKISDALPVLQKIQGIWGGLSSDLTAIVNIIDTNIDKVIPMLKSLGVDAAVKAWGNVANEANDYRVNAYIQVDNSAATAA